MMQVRIRPRHHALDDVMQAVQLETAGTTMRRQMTGREYFRLIFN